MTTLNASLSGTTCTVTGTAPPNSSVAIKRNGTTVATVTADGVGAYSTTVTGLASGDHTFVATPLSDLSPTPKNMEVCMARILLTGTATQNTQTPTMTANLFLYNSATTTSRIIVFYYRASGGSTWIIGGSALTDGSSNAVFTMPTSLADGTWEFMATAGTLTDGFVEIKSGVISITTNRPNEAPIMPTSTYAVDAGKLINMFVPVNPPNGYVIGAVTTKNSPKPAVTATVGGASTGISINGSNQMVVSDPTQFTTAGTRGVTYTVTNVAGSASVALVLTTVAVSATTSYSDSVGGNDANAGDLPTTAKQSVTLTTTIRRFKRGGSYASAVGLSDNRTLEAYGSPADGRPKFGVGVAYGIQSTDPDNTTVRGLEFNGVTTRGVEISTFSNMLVEDCACIGGLGSQGFKFHNSNNGYAEPDAAGVTKPATLTVPDLPNRKFSLIFRNNDIVFTKGDSLYCTHVNGGLIENNSMDAAYGSGADCIQFAYEGNGQNISGNLVIRGNILLQRPEAQTNKGALVTEQTFNTRVEYNYIGGKVFSYSSIGNSNHVRSNWLKYGSTGQFQCGEQNHQLDHRIYDNLLSDGNCAIKLTSFGDSTISYDNGSTVVFGYQRSDFYVHDNIFRDNSTAFFADRPWSGLLYRNIFMRNGTNIDRHGNATVSGLTVANRGTETTQGIFNTDFTNDGSWLNATAPAMSGTVAAGNTMSVTTGTWTLNGVTTTPDEVLYAWRDKDGWDFVTGNGSSSFVVPAAASSDVYFELSCVVLARKGTNWMLAVAEKPFPATDYFIPRSVAEGILPWQKRYFRVGDVA